MIFETARRNVWTFHCIKLWNSLSIRSKIEVFTHKNAIFEHCCQVLHAAWVGSIRAAIEFQRNSPSRDSHPMLLRLMRRYVTGLRAVLRTNIVSHALQVAQNDVAD
jgi:hypothetical protein